MGDLSKRKLPRGLYSICSAVGFRSSKTACLLAGVLVAGYIYVALKAFVPAVQQRGIDQFHLTHSSFPEWALLQPIPAMYNYANELWIGNRPYIERNAVRADKSTDHHYTYINHYPLRIISFSWYRSKFLTDTNFDYITLKSTYQNTSQVTHYRISDRSGAIYLEQIP